MAFTIPNAASAAYPAQAEIFQTDLDILVAGLNNAYVVSGCAVTAQGSPNMTVAVALGVVIIDGVYVTVAAGNVTITTANGSNPRIDLITVDASGVLAVSTGTAAANPLPNALPASKVVLAQVYVQTSAANIPSNNIVDRRAINGNGPGLEIAYADLAADPASITTTAGDISGLSITFNAPSRPFMLEVHIPWMTMSSIDPAFTTIYLTDSANTTVAWEFNRVPVTNYAMFFDIRARLPRTGSGSYSITAGTSYTFKVRAATSAGTAAIPTSSGTVRPFIRAVTC